ncbi:uncharacterized protein LOC21392156 [Morus notabilis]|uniref:uncharacterized protein LOC21392156 n=1 Tax=Morus notabilis TaxID=981085 RepID=UPI000CECF61E|nr:uncharacterized protein LOC21392156 [Morus notabilis]
MAISLHGNTTNWSILCERRASWNVGISALPLLHKRVSVFDGFVRGLLGVRLDFYSRSKPKHVFFLGDSASSGHGKMMSKRVILTIPGSSGSSSNSNGTKDDSNQEKTPFGYNRKDVLLIGLGVTVLGIGLKSGLEFVGVDPLQAGNVVQLVLVLGLTIGWISTYIFRVSNKEMTYAQQLRDYEKKVMERRLEGLSEAELEALLEQVEEEKRRLASGDQVK